MMKKPATFCTIFLRGKPVSEDKETSRISLFVMQLKIIYKTCQNVGHNLLGEHTYQNIFKFLILHIGKYYRKWVKVWTKRDYSGEKCISNLFWSLIIELTGSNLVMGIFFFNFFKELY